MNRRSILSLFALTALVIASVGEPSLSQAEGSEAPARTPRKLKSPVRAIPKGPKPARSQKRMKPAPATKAGPRVMIQTNMGDIVVELNPTAAPVTVRNFLAYVKSGFYNGTIFHRVIKTFMIQGGGYNQKFVKKRTRKPIKLEAQNGLSNVRGTIAMARTRVPNSATSQFFINVSDNSRSLDNGGGGYAVFGKVIRGMNVVDAIRKLPTSAQSGQPDAPTKMVVIRKAKPTR